MNTIEMLQSELQRAEEEQANAAARIKALKKSIEKENERLAVIKDAKIIVQRLDEVIWKHFYPNWQPDDETLTISDDNCFMYFEEDIKCIFRDNDIDRAKEYIFEQIHLQSSAPVESYIKKHLHMDKCIDDAMIRKDFAAALRSVKHGDDLSGRLDWSFSPKDISELAKLHKAGKFRKKIENLLTDCNFHSECSMITAKQYDELIL